MVHTRYHFRVHADALPGALARLGAALSAPLIAADSAAREVDNVHSEFSRNTNSDGRKLLQLRRSLCRPPYSSFSTGNIETLWTQPAAAGGLDVPAALRALWARCYSGGATCVAVVGPQPPQQLLSWVAAAFGGMPGSGCVGQGAAAAHAPAAPSSPRQQQPPPGARHCLDVCGERGRLVRVCPQRELRDLELSWCFQAHTRYSRCA